MLPTSEGIMKNLTCSFLCLLTMTGFAVAGVSEDVKAAAKSSLQGSLVKDVQVNGTTATITYKSLGASDWSGDSRERTAARCIPKVLQKVSSIKKVIIVIEQDFRAVMTRSDANSFYGVFTSDDDFKKNVSDGVVYNKARLAQWNREFVVLKK